MGCVNSKTLAHKAALPSTERNEAADNVVCKAKSVFNVQGYRFPQGRAENLPLNILPNAQKAFGLAAPHYSLFREITTTRLGHVIDCF